MSERPKLKCGPGELVWSHGEYSFRKGDTSFNVVREGEKWTWDIALDGDDLPAPEMLKSLERYPTAKQAAVGLAETMARMHEATKPFAKGPVWRDAPETIEEKGLYRVEWDAEGCPPVWWFESGDRIDDMSQFPEGLPAYPQRIAGPITITEPREPKEEA